MTRTDFDARLEEWKVLYHDAETIDGNIDKGACWESLCNGWCLAKGMTLNEAYRFYNYYCIPNNVF